MKTLYCFSAMRLARISFITLFTFSFSLLTLKAQNIYTVAGNGYFDYSGDGGLAGVAQFYNSFAVAVDKAGNMYVADQGNNCIRKINNNGIVSTFAGTGVAGFWGDGGQASSAKLNKPADVAVDGAGNVYVSDQGNNVIRKINTAGIITTIVGDDTAGYRGDGGLASKARVNGPSGLTCDAGGILYIADAGNQRIRMISSGIISTVAGNGSPADSGDGRSAILAAMNKPVAVALDGLGNMFIADQNNNKIRMVNSGGIITTLAGNSTAGYSGDGGSAGSAELYKPFGVAADTKGNVYIADWGNNRLRLVNKSRTISTLAGNGTASYHGDGGPATASELNAPTAVIIDDTGNVYIADNKNDRIRKIDTLKNISTVAGDGTGGYSGNNGNSLSCSLSYPDGLALDASGNLYIADRINNVVRKMYKSGVITTIAGNGTSTYSGDGGQATAAGLNSPSNVAIDASGNIYIADGGNNRIRKVDTITGIITTIAGNGTAGFSGDGGSAIAAELNTPYGVTIDAAGNIYLTDELNYRVRKINTSGKISTIAGNGVQGYSGDNKPATAAELSKPLGIIADAAGDVYIADSWQMLIRKVNINDTITTVAGNRSVGYSGDGGAATSAALNGPSNVSMDVKGNLYITDQGNNCIRVVDNTGTIYTFAGTGVAGYFGDGWLATLAKLNQPAGIAIDDSSNVFIADHYNNRIREISKKSPLATNELIVKSEEVRAFPNPSHGLFNLSIRNYELGMKYTAEAYNILGEKIYSNVFLIPNSQFLIDLSNKPSGIYLYRVLTENGDLIGAGKLIKE